VYVSEVFLQFVISPQLWRIGLLGWAYPIQKARSGHRIRPAMREYIQRLPKLRGYANKSTQDVPTLITLEKLSALKQTAISRKALVEAKMIRSEGERVKILGNGEITKAITVEGVPMSASAKAKIEKAGGSVK
jgi:large subunit ribosomal protein L15